jgi:hypothetical protein
MRRRLLAALAPLAVLMAAPAGALAAINEAYRPPRSSSTRPSSTCSSPRR